MTLKTASRKEVKPMTNHTNTQNDGRSRCPECNSTNWLIDQSDVDGIQLHTTPPTRPGDRACNRCGHVWQHAA